MMAGDLLGERARLTPDKLALTEVRSGRRFTYRDLNRRASALSGVLLKQCGLARAMDTRDEQTGICVEDCGTNPLAIEIRPLRLGEDGSAFRILNEEWITRYFVLEEKDRETLGDPENQILRKGGHIFMVYRAGEAVGCVALIPMGNGVYELSKMAVSPRLRGLGIGRKLLEYAIVQAKAIGARSLFLGSSTKLKNAVHLYESIGFRHVPPGKIPPMPYTRADVFMEMPL